MHWLQRSRRRNSCLFRTVSVSSYSLAYTKLILFNLFQPGNCLYAVLATVAFLPQAFQLRLFNSRYFLKTLLTFIYFTQSLFRISKFQLLLPELMCVGNFGLEHWKIPFPPHISKLFESLKSVSSYLLLFPYSLFSKFYYFF